MSAQANYFKIGLFVIIAFIVLAGGVVFWGASALRQEKYYVETYMNESVKGLTQGSQVFYAGILVGEVDMIATAPAVYNAEPGSEAGQYIVIRIALTHENITSRKDQDQYFKEVVQKGLCFQMKSSPLTGIGYLEAGYYEDKINPEPWTAWESKYIYIPSVPSLLSKLADSAETIFGKLTALDPNTLLTNTNNLLVHLDEAVQDLQVAKIREDPVKLITHTDETILQLKSLVRSTQTEKPPVTVEDIMVNLNTSIDSLNVSIKDADIKGISDKGQALLTELRQSNQKLQSLLRSTDDPKPMTNVEEILADLDDAIRQINLMIKQQYPNIDLTIHNLKDGTGDLKEGIKGIKDQPSKLFFSKPPKKSETVK